jgi:hypothetical protein
VQENKLGLGLSINLNQLEIELTRPGCDVVRHANILRILISFTEVKTPGGRHEYEQDIQPCISMILSINKLKLGRRH